MIPGGGDRFPVREPEAIDNCRVVRLPGLPDAAKARTGPDSVSYADILDGPRPVLSLHLSPGDETRNLIAPRGVVLGTAQPVGLLGGVERADGAVGPGEPALGRLVNRAVVVGGAGEDARLPLHHRVARVGGGRGDQGDAAGQARGDPRQHPLDARAGLAEAASGEDQPDEPVAGRGELRVARVELPVTEENRRRFRREGRQEGRPLRRGERQQLRAQAARRAGRGRR